jgi:hypothetical protein
MRSGPASLLRSARVKKTIQCKSEKSTRCNFQAGLSRARCCGACTCGLRVCGFGFLGDQLHHLTNANCLTLFSLSAAFLRQLMTDLIAKRKSTHLRIVLESAIPLVGLGFKGRQFNLSMQSKFVPMTSSRAITDMPFLAKGGGFLDFLFVPFCRECKSAPKAKGESAMAHKQKYSTTH